MYLRGILPPETIVTAGRIVVMDRAVSKIDSQQPSESLLEAYKTFYINLRIRQAKISGIAKDIPDVVVDGPDDAELLVVGWGSTWGAIDGAVNRVRAKGRSVAKAHLARRDPAKARKALARALELEPANAEALALKKTLR